MMMVMKKNMCEDDVCLGAALVFRTSLLMNNSSTTARTKQKKNGVSAQQNKSLQKAFNVSPLIFLLLTWFLPGRFHADSNKKKPE